MWYNQRSPLYLEISIEEFKVLLNKFVRDLNKGIKKLNYQRLLLTEAYKKGYVKKKSFDEGKKTISRLIIRLKKRL